MSRLKALEQVLAAAEAVLSAREDQMLTRVEWEALEDAVRNVRGKTAYLVATLARYVLVDAENEEEARRLGRIALREMFVDEAGPLAKDASINIHTIRPAADDEIALQRAHERNVTAWNG